MSIRLKHEHLTPRDALSAGKFDEIIHSALAELARHRRLTRAELRLRCIVAPRPWRNSGCDRSTWFRRRKRAQLATELARAA